MDSDFWQQHWDERGSMASAPPNPYVVRETVDLVPGTALDAGCGAGAEAIWLASRGWRVTGADIAPQALARAAERSTEAGVDVAWVEADVAVWEPEQPLDLVVSSYAHASIPQLDLYARLATWVAPGGTLLLVGHLHGDHAHGHPEEATVTLESMRSLLGEGWEVVTAAEHTRAHGHHELHDVVLRSRRVGG